MPRLGAWAADGAVEFCTWAPTTSRVEVVINAPGTQRVPMARAAAGYHFARVEGLGPGARYRFLLDGDEESGPRPDPASRWQPDDVHGDSAVIDPAFAWSDVEWIGLPLAEYVIYELHVGTFTPTGTFDAVIDRLDDLHDLGITAIELMPVAEFPGGRNWGYDGVFPYAAESAYGGPDGLRRLVDAAHRRGLAVILDVVYNHLGPEGNVLPAYGPYFTDRYRTPWGDALNFDGPGSDEVRRFFIENALGWIADFRLDALRLDAVHTIADPERVSVRRATRRHRASIRPPPRPARARHRRECSQRQPAHHGKGARWHRLRRAVERRLPPFVAHAPHRRPSRLLRRLRDTRRSGDCLRARFRVHGPLLDVSSSPARAPRRHRRRPARRALRRVRPEPRPGRQPRPAIASRPRSVATAFAWRRSPSCARRSSHCSSWARSTARRIPSRTSSRTPIPRSSKRCDAGAGPSSRRSPSRNRRIPRPRRRSTTRSSIGRSADANPMPRCSSGIASCWRCVRADRHCECSTSRTSRPLSSTTSGRSLSLATRPMTPS